MKRKKAFSLILSSLLFTTVSCGNSGTKIELEEDFPDHQTFELSDKEINFPLATAVNSSGTPLSYDVDYKVTSSDGAVYESKFPSFRLGVGDYTFTYTYQKQTLTYDFKVRDTTKPNIIFTNVPASLFYEKGMPAQYLPSYEVDDYSWGDLGGLDFSRHLYFTDGITKEKKELPINLMKDSYEVPGYGTFEYVISATDRENNTATNTATWLAKDYSWKDDSLEEGTLADFNKEGYVNYVKTGDVSPYYAIGNDFKSEILDSFEGATGVLHLDMGFSNAAGAIGSFNSISLKLAKEFHYSDMDNKYLAVRAYITGDGLLPQFGFAGNHKKTREDALFRCQTSAVNGLETGKWKTYYIARGIAEYCEMTSDGKTSSPIEALQLYFQNQSAKNRMNLYIDSISLAEKLPTTEIHVGDTISWDSVDHVDHYEVDVNGSIMNTKNTSLETPEGKGYLKVTPCGDGVRTLDGDDAQSIYGVSLAKDVVAGFDDALYGNLFNTELDFSTATDNEGYRPRSYSTSLSSEGLVLNLPASSWGIVTGIRFQFPKAIKASDYDYLMLTLKMEETNFNLLRIYDYASHHQFVSQDFNQDDQGKFMTIRLSLSSLNPEDTLKGLTLIYGKGGGPASSKVAVTFKSLVGIRDEIEGVAKQDDSKVIGIKLRDGVLSNTSSLDLTKIQTASNKNNTLTSASLENNVVKLNLGKTPEVSETFTLKKATVLQSGSDSYTLPEDATFVYLEDGWNLLKGDRNLSPCYADPSHAQFDFFYDFGCKEMDEKLSFYGRVFWNGKKITNFEVTGYPNTEKICFVFDSAVLTGIKEGNEFLTIRKDSYVYHNGIAIRIASNFKGTYNASRKNLDVVSN